MSIYVNTEGALVVGRGWTLTAETNTALDEYHDEPDCAGLFTAQGWCIIGTYTRWRTRAGIVVPRPGRVGVILCNMFFGLWQDPEAERYRPLPEGNLQ